MDQHTVRIDTATIEPVVKQVNAKRVPALGEVSISGPRAPEAAAHHMEHFLNDDTLGVEDALNRR